jgi:hypothetical protein
MAGNNDHTAGQFDRPFVVAAEKGYRLSFLARPHVLWHLVRFNAKHVRPWIQVGDGEAENVTGATLREIPEGEPVQKFMSSSVHELVHGSFLHERPVAPLVAAAVEATHFAKARRGVGVYLRYKDIVPITIDTVFNVRHL